MPRTNRVRQIEQQDRERSYYCEPEIESPIMRKGLVMSGSERAALGTPIRVSVPGSASPT